MKTKQGFSDFEKEAMKERAQELLAGKGEGENAVMAAIDKLSEPDRNMAKRLHEIVKASAPSLTPKTWYGMPAYANKEGKAVCFFQAASKFRARYATFGFNDSAKLDDGSMWPTSFALKKLGKVEEAKIVALLKQAVEENLN